MTCVEMGASYDSLRTKIESVTQAQQKMIEAIGKADFNTLMPMGTATSHGNKIQWVHRTLTLCNMRLVF